MGREARRVPFDWEHPRCTVDDGYVPLHGNTYEQELVSRVEYPDGWDSDPDPADHMPAWSDGEAAGWQMYEDTTEGTPISPVMKSPEDLARWLADNGASAFADMTATYEQWLATIQRGSAPSMVMDASGMHSGVEALADETETP